MTNEELDAAWILRDRIIDCEDALDHFLKTESVNVYIPKWMVTVVAPAIEEHMKKLKKDFAKL